MVGAGEFCAGDQVKGPSETTEGGVKRPVVIEKKKKKKTSHTRNTRFASIVVYLLLLFVTKHTETFSPTMSGKKSSAELSVP